MGSISNSSNAIFTKDQQSKIYLDGKWVPNYDAILEEYPSKINEIKKEFNREELEVFLEKYPLTKLYYKEF